jgi:hypothetical protein
MNGLRFWIALLSQCSAAAGGHLLRPLTIGQRKAPPERGQGSGDSTVLATDCTWRINRPIAEGAKRKPRQRGAGLRGVLPYGELYAATLGSHCWDFRWLRRGIARSSPC